MKYFYLSLMMIFCSTKGWGDGTWGIGSRFDIGDGINTQSNYFLISQIDTGAIKEVKNDMSWIINEPLGGVLGGVAGGVTGFFVGMGVSYVVFPSFLSDENYFPLFIGALIGHAFGSATGVWLTGKYVEKENGTFFGALIGSVIGGVVCMGLAFNPVPLYSLSVAVITVTGYQLSGILRNRRKHEILYNNFKN